VVKIIARKFGEKVMALLLHWPGQNIVITEDVVEAAADNWNSSKQVMTLLLRQSSNVGVGSGRASRRRIVLRAFPLDGIP
jgi:hypothetical protein